MKFHHNPDNRIVIEVNGAVYEASATEFASDIAALGLPAYAGLPSGFRERVYTDTYHRLYTNDTQSAGPEVWPEGDAYVASIARLVSASAAGTLFEGGKVVVNPTSPITDVLLGQENRIRALEGKAAITKAEYRDALIVSAVEAGASAADDLV